MVSGVSSFSPLTFLNDVKGIAPTPDSSTADATDSTDSTTSSTSTTTTPANALGIPSDVLNALQGTDSTSSSIESVLSSLLGGSSDSAGGGVLSSLLGGNTSIDSSDPLAGVYNTLLYNDSTANPLQVAINSAQQQQSQTAASTANPVTNALSSLNTAINSYNQTLLQTAQSVAAANNFGADGKTPLVA